MASPMLLNSLSLFDLNIQDEYNAIDTNGDIFIFENKDDYDFYINVKSQ